MSLLQSGVLHTSLTPGEFPSEGPRGEKHPIPVYRTGADLSALEDDLMVITGEQTSRVLLAQPEWERMRPVAGWLAAAAGIRGGKHPAYDLDYVEAGSGVRHLYGMTYLSLLCLASNRPILLCEPLRGLHPGVYTAMLQHLWHNTFRHLHPEGSFHEQALVTLPQVIADTYFRDLYTVKQLQVVASSILAEQRVRTIRETDIELGTGVYKKWLAPKTLEF